MKRNSVTQCGYRQGSVWDLVDKRAIVYEETIARCWRRERDFKIIISWCRNAKYLTLSYTLLLLAHPAVASVCGWLERTLPFLKTTNLWFL